MFNRLPSEQIALLGTIDPDAYSASTIVSDYVDMSKYESIMIVLLVGDMGASATIDAVVKQATTSAGAGAKNLTSSKAITQLTQAGTDSNKQVIINVTATDLDMDNSFDFAAISVTIATAACDFGAAIFGINPRYGIASDNDLSTVDEIVS